MGFSPRERLVRSLARRGCHVGPADRRGIHAVTRRLTSNAPVVGRLHVRELEGRWSWALFTPGLELADDAWMQAPRDPRQRSTSLLGIPLLDQIWRAEGPWPIAVLKRLQTDLMRLAHHPADVSVRGGQLSVEVRGLPLDEETGPLAAGLLGVWRELGSDAPPPADDGEWRERRSAAVRAWLEAAVEPWQGEVLVREKSVEGRVALWGDFGDGLAGPPPEGRLLVEPLPHGGLLVELRADVPGCPPVRLRGVDAVAGLPAAWAAALAPFREGLAPHGLEGAVEADELRLQAVVPARLGPQLPLVVERVLHLWRQLALCGAGLLET